MSDANDVPLITSNSETLSETRIKTRSETRSETLIKNKCKKYGGFNNLTYLNRLLTEIKKITELSGSNFSLIDGLLISYTLELKSIYKQMTHKNDKTYNKLKLKSKKTNIKTHNKAIKIEKLLEKIKKECTKEPSHLTIGISPREYSAGKKRKVNESKKNKKRKSRGKRLKKTKKR